MKYLSFLFLFIVINTMYAQKYQPLVEERKYWTYATYDTGDNPCDLWWPNQAEIHHFGEDTLLNNLKYKKILNSSLELTGTMGSIKFPFEIKQTNVMGYIREDTIAKKVYVIPNNLFFYPCKEEQKENLLFDFSLMQGDSINDCLAYYVYQDEQSNYPKIDSIKYELDFQNKLRKHLYSFGYFEPCSFWHVPGYIIEGFGFKDGPFRGQINRRLVNYCEGTLEQCNIISSAKDDRDTPSDKIAIYPNPASDFITFHNATHYSTSVNGYCIRDMSNQVLRSVQELQSETNYIIHTHDFPLGMYIIQFLKDGQIVQSEKFIVSR